MTAKLDATPLWDVCSWRVPTRNDSEAGDLVQESSAYIFSLTRACDTSGPLLAWLIAAVRNAFVKSVARTRAGKLRLGSNAELSSDLKKA